MKKTIIFSLIEIIFCLLSLKFFPQPWIWIFASMIIFFLTSAVMAKKQLFKILLFNALALPVLFLLAESYFYFNSPKNKKVEPAKNGVVISGTYRTHGYNRKDEVLGYAPIPGIQRTLKHTTMNVVIYDVTYTINKNGLRQTPSSNNSSTKCIIFFGGSFTFGEGLNDHETLPYYMGKELNEDYRIFNFGFHGYGPHQMLSAIEHGLLDNITKECRQLDVIYGGIPAHIARTAGYSPWDKYGPKYIIENDEVIYKGHFVEPASPVAVKPPNFVTKVKNILGFHLKKFSLFSKIFHKRNKPNKRKYSTNKNQMKTFIKIIEKSQNLMRISKNASTFIILFWDKHNLSSNIDKKNSDAIIKEFSKKGFEYYLVGNILDKYNNNRKLYSVSPHNRHPSAKTNRLLAKYMIKKLGKQVKSHLLKLKGCSSVICGGREKRLQGAPDYFGWKVQENGEIRFICVEALRKARYKLRKHKQAVIDALSRASV